MARSLLLVCFFQLPFWIAGAEWPTASFPADPGLDLEKAWESLQSIIGTWTSNEEDYIEWEWDSAKSLKKTLVNGERQREIGRLIKKEDKIIYQLKTKEKQFILQLSTISPKSWTFEAKTDQLLQTVELLVTDEGILRSQMTAVSPSGRRMNMHSDLQPRN
mgnify:CR=1 FL=1